MLQKETLIEMNWEEDELYHNNNKLSEHERQIHLIGPGFFSSFAYTSRRTPSSRWPISHRALPAPYPVSQLQHVMKRQLHHPQEDKGTNGSFHHQEEKQISMSSLSLSKGTNLWSNESKQHTDACLDPPSLPSMISQNPLSHTNQQNSLPFPIRCSSRTWKPSKQRSGG